MDFKMDIKPAGFSKRLFAYNIDMSILMLFFIPLYMFIDVQRWFFVSALVVSILYFSIMESSQLQATLGKKIAGLSVITIEGRHLSFARAFVRTFIKMASVIILFVGMILIYIRKDKKALHDLIVGTYVKQNT